jgi:hypothetical protein
MKSAVTYISGCGKMAFQLFRWLQPRQLEVLADKKRIVRIQVKKMKPAEIPFAMLS